MPQVSHIHLYCARGESHPKKQKKGTTNPNLEKTDTKKKKRFNDKEQENQENDDKRPHILIVAPDPMKLCCK